MAEIKCVYGPPCSGKTTYVRRNAGSRDVVWDFDEIRAAVALRERYASATEAQNNMVLKLRYAFMANAESSEAEIAWFICVTPDDFIRETLGETAVYVEMETSEEECLRRLEEDESRPDKERMKALIKKYFSDKEAKSMDYVMMKPPETERECRNFMEFRALTNEQSPYTVTGYACTYDKYPLYGKFNERIARDAFAGADLSDVIFQYDHEGRVFARTSNGTLQVTPDEKGLFIRADLSKSAAAKELFEEIRAGLITKMSFGFMVAQDHAEDDGFTRVIDRFSRIYDVSAVSLPANDNTAIGISARGFFDAVEERKARAALELQRRRLQIKMKAGY